MSIVVITGGRNYVAQPGDKERLLVFLREYKATLVRHGGCRGADTWSGRIAHASGYEVEVWPATTTDSRRWHYNESSYARIVYPPSWAKWPSAGPRRNAAMLQGAGKPADHLGAWPGGTGTHRCIESAIAQSTNVVMLRERSSAELESASRPERS